MKNLLVLFAMTLLPFSASAKAPPVRTPSGNYIPSKGMKIQGRGGSASVAMSDAQSSAMSQAALLGIKNPMIVFEKANYQKRPTGQFEYYTATVRLRQNPPGGSSATGSIVADDR